MSLLYESVYGSSATNFNVKLYENDDKWMPTKSHDDDAGFDLRMRVAKLWNEGRRHRGQSIKTNGITLYPGDRALCHTGVFLELWEGWEAQVRPRSGLAFKHGLTIVNSPGTIDAGYRNEIAVIIQNNDDESVDLFLGDRIAQMIIKKVPEVILTKVEEINDTERGQDGFGSTGEK